MTIRIHWIWKSLEGNHLNLTYACRQHIKQISYFKPCTDCAQIRTLIAWHQGNLSHVLTPLTDLLQRGNVPITRVTWIIKCSRTKECWKIPSNQIYIVYKCLYLYASQLVLFQSRSGLCPIQTSWLDFIYHKFCAWKIQGGGNKC